MSNEIILEYSNYIYGLTKYFKNYKNKEDLYQVGCIGLINAYNKFNPNLGAKFTTYAYPYILGEMHKLVREDRIIKLSQNITGLGLKIEKATLLLAQKLYRYPTIKEISDFLEIDETIITETLKSNNSVMSTDEVIYNDGKEITILDTINSSTTDIDTLISLKQELSNLSKEDRILFENSVINNYKQEEIAELLGINQVQVSRKLNKIKQRIKTNVA